MAHVVCCYKNRTSNTQFSKQLALINLYSFEFTCILERIGKMSGGTIYEQLLFNISDKSFGPIDTTLGHKPKPPSCEVLAVRDLVQRLPGNQHGHDDRFTDAGGILQHQRANSPPYPEISMPVFSASGASVSQIRVPMASS